MTENKGSKIPGGAGARKNRVKPQTVKRLLAYLKDYKLKFPLVLVSILVSSVVGVVASLFLQTLIDDYIAPLLLMAVPDYSGLVRILLIMAGVYSIGVMATLVYNRTMMIIAEGIMKRIRDDMFAHMQTLPIRYFDTHHHGDVMSYYTNDTDTLRQMLAQGIPQVFSSLLTIVAVFGAMLYLSLWLTLFVAAFALVASQLVRRIAGKSRKHFVKQQKAIADLNGYVEEMINGQKVIKVFCHEEEVKRAFDEKNETLCENTTAANKYAIILMPIMNNLGFALYVLLAIVGGFMAVKGMGNVGFSGIGVVSVGMIVSFLQLSRSLIGPLSQVSQQINHIIMAMAGAERIFELLDEESEHDEGYVTLVNAKYGENGEIVETTEHTGMWAWKHPHKDGSVTYTKLTGDVKMAGVDFSYTEGKPVLHDITLYAEPGQKVAFVGATGAGKTTITNLINRFYDIADGKIRYDGININKIKKSDLRRSLGVVLQDVSLFTGTVMENIRYGRLDATDEECIEAAKLANADAFIRMLPQGYDTVITGDGSGLSQGQRQLISIARAAVADPPVMILDEATSSIDTRTEAIVQKGMDRLMEGRTVFVIAHRLSTVKNADVIMVLDHGRIIERGSHEKLIAEKGRYYQLYTGVFELE
ncbi:MAG: ABC transporter ATP-binding protein [Christensenellales bacterium]|jgi:ATP-binding cassette subfamily B multidrug efflux pump